MDARRLGWRPKRTRFVLWRRIERPAAWKDLRGRHGVNLPGRVQVLAVRQGTARLVPVDPEDFDAWWRKLQRDGWRCTIVRVPAARREV